KYLPRKSKSTEQADQGRQCPSRSHAIKGVEQFAYLLGRALGHETTLANQLPRINLANADRCKVPTRRPPGPTKIPQHLRCESFARRGRLRMSMVRRLGGGGTGTTDDS